MSRPYDLFIAFLLITLSVGVLAVNAGHDWLTASLFLGVFGTGLILQAKLTGRRYFSGPERAKEAEQTVDPSLDETRFFFRGIRLEPPSLSDTPDVVTEMTTGGRVILMRVATAVLVLIYGYGSYELHGGARVHFEDLIFLATAICLLRASSLGHFIVALGLVSISVFFSSLADRPQQLAWSLGYAFLATLTLAQYLRADREVVRARTAQVTLKGPSVSDEESVGPTLFSAIGIFVIAVGVGFVWDNILPDSSSPRPVKTSPVVRKLSAPSATTFSGRDAPSGLSSSSGSSSHDLNLSPSDLHQVMGMLNAASRADLDRSHAKALTDLAERFGQNLRSDSSAGSSNRSGAGSATQKLALSDEDLCLLKDALERQKDRFESFLRGPTNNNLKVGAGDSPSDLAAPSGLPKDVTQAIANLGAAQRALDQLTDLSIPTPAPSDSDLLPSLGRAGPITNGLPSRPQASAPKSPLVSAAPEKPKFSFPKIPDFDLTKLKALLRPLLTFGLVCLGVAFLFRVLHRPAPEQLEQSDRLDREKKRALRRELAELQRSSFSPPR